MPEGNSRPDQSVITTIFRNKALKGDLSMSRKAIVRWLAGAGSAILMITAVLHTSGYSEVAHAVGTAQLSPMLAGVFKGAWILFSVYMILPAVVMLPFAFRSRPSSRGVVGVCAAFLAAMDIVLIIFVGVFIGSILLSVATVLILAAAVLSER
jgi:hypothetical protein